jgi:hypothetical protein
MPTDKKGDLWASVGRAAQEAWGAGLREAEFQLPFLCPEAIALEQVIGFYCRFDCQYVVDPCTVRFKGKAILIFI